jgi:lipoprotein-anchoring transpeptidase ErfK/SrfK
MKTQRLPLAFSCVTLVSMILLASSATRAQDNSVLKLVSAEQQTPTRSTNTSPPASAGKISANVRKHASLTPAAPAARSTSARAVVTFQGFPAGTVVVKTNERRLYYVLGDNKAVRYPVGVGRTGLAWVGTAQINGKYLKPAWSPPADIKREHPSTPDLIPGGTAENPMGAAALTLSGGEYAIHGTNNPGSVGGFVSYGCIRMYDQDVMDLYERVSYGTTVVVLL